MSEMLERVARAIGAVIGDYSEGAGWLGDNTHEIGLKKARAAMEALREPTDAMIERGDVWADGPGYSIKVIEAMIDEALK